MNWSNASPLPWSTIATQWNTAAKGESVTLAEESGYSITSARVIKAESITFTANAGQTLTHGALYPATATFGVTASQASVGGFVFADAISFAAEPLPSMRGLCLGSFIPIQFHLRLPQT